MLIKFLSSKNVSDVAMALEDAVKANGFGLMQVHNLKETMIKKGVAFDRDCLIFEVCQPQQAKRVLDQNMSMSTALPCRISVYREGDKTVVATIKPTILLSLFGSIELEATAKEIEETITKIMKEAVSVNEK